MLICTVRRTHREGEPIAGGHFGTGVSGCIRMFAAPHQELRRTVKILQIIADGESGHAVATSLIPDLIEPELLTFSSDRGMMIVGFEQIGRRRFYQGWWLQWTEGPI